ncbi:MAG: RNA polymerase sigma factor [Nitrospira sp.]
MGYDAEVEADTGDHVSFTGAQALVSDDAECIDRVLRGDIDRFSELIARHQQHVLKIVHGHVPADRVAEVAQDVFVRAYAGLSQYSRQVPLEHWLSRLSVRACYDFWRAHRRTEVPVSGLTDDQVGWLDRALADESGQRFRDQADRRDSLEVLDWALTQLSPEHRLVLTLVSLEGRSVREAAELLGWTVVNVKVRCYRARQALRAMFLREWERHQHDRPS